MNSPDLTEIAALIADPTRSEMLLTLMDGTPRTASALAAAANVSPSTASHHLKALLDGGLVSVDIVGRERYHRISGYPVAELLELLGTLSLGRDTPRISRRNSLRPCRTCYDHLAGSVAVEIRKSLEMNAYIEADGDRFEVTANGGRFFCDLGIDVAELRTSRRAFARACIDWTERVPHIGGSLGAALLSCLTEKRWVVRGATPRLLEVTPLGAECLQSIFHLIPPDRLSKSSK